MDSPGDLAEMQVISFITPNSLFYESEVGAQKLVFYWEADSLKTVFQKILSMVYREMVLEGSDI